MQQRLLVLNTPVLSLWAEKLLRVDREPGLKYGVFTIARSGCSVVD